MELPILVSANTEEGSTKGIFTSRDVAILKRVDVDQLRANLKQVCDGMVEVLRDIRAVGELKLKSVQIGIEISAEGGVTLIGTATVGGKGAITLTFGD